MAEKTPTRLRVSSSSSVPKSVRLANAEERILADLVSEGLVTRGEGALTPFKPLRIAGKPLTETLLEDRNDRF
ncbi:MAG: hypothetical protein ABUT39_15055 [Acidobacteriota bacterium]